MMTNSMSKVLCGAVFGIVASVSMAASAGNYSETFISTTAEGLRTATVSFADLDLTRSEDQEVLHERLSSAAKQVCGSTSVRETGSLSAAAENKSCYEQAMDSAMSQASSSQVAVVSR